MDFFEIFNKQFIKEDLTKIDEKLLALHNMSMAYLEGLLNKHGLDINNLYVVNSTSCEAYYLGDYICTNIYLIKDVLENDLLGINRIKLREKIGKDLFDKKKYYDLFNQENNKMPLYFFLKHYKEIDKENVFDVFISMYQQIHYGFDKIDEAIYTYIKQYKPSNEYFLNQMILNGEVSSTSSINTELTIYRAQGIKSTDLKSAKSWTLSLDFARKMNTKCCGYIYEAVVNVADIICYVDNFEHEVLVDYNKLNKISIYS